MVYGLWPMVKNYASHVKGLRRNMVRVVDAKELMSWSVALSSETRKIITHAFTITSVSEEAY